MIHRPLNRIMAVGLTMFGTGYALAGALAGGSPIAVAGFAALALTGAWLTVAPKGKGGQKTQGHGKEM